MMTASITLSDLSSTAIIENDKYLDRSEELGVERRRQELEFIQLVHRSEGLLLKVSDQSPFRRLKTFSPSV